MCPDIAKLLQGLNVSNVDTEDGVGLRTTNPITNLHNTVGSLEQYAERILVPANIFQEFLQAKNKFKKKYPLECFLQAPVVPLEEVQRFCSLMLKLPTDRDADDNDDSFINIVVTGKLEMAVTSPPHLPEIPVKPSEPPPPRIIATIQCGGGPNSITHFGRMG
jgi:hypothetical protein